MSGCDGEKNPKSAMFRSEQTLRDVLGQTAGCLDESFICQPKTSDTVEQFHDV